MSGRADLRLGRKGGVVNDSRTLQVRRLLRGAPPPPKRHMIARALSEFPLFGNDQIGDCTYAAQGHRVVAQEHSTHQREIKVSTADVVAAYSRLTGYRPEDPSTDQGAYCLDVCNDMRNRGVGLEKDGTPHTIYAFAAVRLKDPVEVKTALRMFGGLYIGAGLPNSAADEFSAGKPWADTEDRFGSWGGHAMYAIGYDERYVHVVTWGRRQKVTWQWWDAYVDEAYALISEDFMFRTGRTPQGFNRDALDRYLAELR